jgi:carbamoyl-phosphate synthase small subunit
MTKKALLVLEDGTFYEGISFGAESRTFGEVVFSTSMAGYQEMLTDPSFAGQIVVPTYPLIGNYGINSTDFESGKIQVKAFIVREYCTQPSHWRSSYSLHEFLTSQDIPGVSGIDTRALTRHLRSYGVLMGMVTSEMSVDEAMVELKKQPGYDTNDFVKEVTTPTVYDWERQPEDGAFNHTIAVVDCGVKYSILRILSRLGCRVTVFPATSSAEEILGLHPDGIVLSPGPGDPALLDYLTTTVEKLVHRVPVMGICLGHQLIARAFGASTFKLKFGHRGGNHPVKDLTTGKIYITTQNHGYAVDIESLSGGLEVSHINSNDGTVEGLLHKELPVISIQYHSEGSPGPRDSLYFFEKFLSMI